MNESRVDCGDAHVAEYWAEVAVAIATRGQDGEAPEACVLAGALEALFA